MNYAALDTEVNSIFDFPNPTGTPERRLLMAIFERALLDYVGNDQKEYDEAKEWLFETLPNDELVHFSFTWICQQLDLNIEDIRKRIKAMPRRGTSRIAPWYLTKGYNTKGAGIKSFSDKGRKAKKGVELVDFSNRRRVGLVD